MDRMCRSIARVLAVSADFFGVQVIAQGKTTGPGKASEGGCFFPCCPQRAPGLDRAAPGATRQRGVMAMTDQCSARRRAMLGAGLALAGGAMCAPAAAQAKISKAQAKYQDRPKDGQRCDGCLHFDPLDSCKLVDGKISPSGWCSLYAAKPR